MATIYRILGTALVFCGFLLIIKFGFQALKTLNQECKLALSAGACRAASLVLSSLLVFFSFYFSMLLTNKVWGRNLFKGRPG
jgi:hypothetical protein